MPKIIIHTNLKDEQLAPDFEDKVALKVSEVINYPLELIHVSVTCGDRMIHNGSKAPMAFINIDTANKFSEEANPGYTPKFQEFFTKEMNIPANRLILHYIATKPTDYGVSRQPPEYKHAEYYV